MSETDQLLLKIDALKSDNRNQNESISALQYVVTRLRADLATCADALHCMIENDEDPNGTAAAALWNNGQPLGKL